MNASGQLQDPAALLPGKELPVSIGQEAGLGLEPVWKRWSIEKYLVPDGNQTLAFQSVARRFTSS
jgi:hypothetical protein